MNDTQLFFDKKRMDGEMKVTGAPTAHTKEPKDKHALTVDIQIAIDKLSLLIKAGNEEGWYTDDVRTLIVEDDQECELLLTYRAAKAEIMKRAAEEHYRRSVDSLRYCEELVDILKNK